ncbi:hypothetical protein HY312_04530 [Candidatus Saccharibacteria bacterium]|nr:hypothetical protein [Candidatus Saccharibacteria bacterium]
MHHIVKAACIRLRCRATLAKSSVALAGNTHPVKFGETVTVYQPWYLGGTKKARALRLHPLRGEMRILTCFLLKDGSVVGSAFVMDGAGAIRPHTVQRRVRWYSKWDHVRDAYVAVLKAEPH